MRLDSTSEDSNAFDYGLIQLNGSPGQTFGFLETDFRRPVEDNPLRTIHHPDGLAKKVSTDTARSVGNKHIQHRADTQGGSSGAPIIMGGRIVGVHERGGCSVPGFNNRGFTLERIFTDADWFKTVDYFEQSEDGGLENQDGFVRGRVGAPDRIVVVLERLLELDLAKRFPSAAAALAALRGEALPTPEEPKQLARRTTAALAPKGPRALPPSSVRDVLTVSRASPGAGPTTWIIYSLVALGLSLAAMPLFPSLFGVLSGLAIMSALSGPLVFSLRSKL